MEPVINTLRLHEEESCACSSAERRTCLYSPPCCAPAPGDTRTVRCAAGITRIAARLGEGADTFTTLIPLSGTVEGDGGADTFRPGRSQGTVGAAASEILYAGGAGLDTATCQGVPATGPTGGTGVRVSLDFAANDGRDADGARPADRDNVQVENLVGGSFGDTLTGDAQAALRRGRRKIPWW